MYSFNVLKLNAVAGLVTNAVIAVCKFSAAAIAAAAQSRLVHAPPALAVLAASEAIPAGPFGVAAAK